MSDTLLRRIRSFHAQLPPHVAERLATKLLMEAKGEIERLNAELREQTTRAEKADAIVAKLPKCWRLVDGKRVQDVPVGLGMVVWWICNGIAWRGRVLGIEEHRLRVMSKDSPNGPCRSAPAVNFCCDTREAAEAGGGECWHIMMA